MIWLKNIYNCPPGEFYYLQTDGIQHMFDRTPLIKQLVANVVDFRRGNKLPRATSTEAMEDIVAYTCNRLGSNNEWCIDTERSVSDLIAPVGSGGGCCGAKL